MRRLDVERQVHAEIVGYAHSIAFREHVGSRSDGIAIILRYRHGLWSSGAVIHIEGGTVTLGELIVSHKLDVVRLIVFGRIPFALVRRKADACIALAKFGP